MSFILKLLISLFIIILCSYVGYLKSKKLKERECILREMVTFLTLVENDILYMMNVLPNAYEIARQKLNTMLKDAIGNIVVDMLNESYGEYMEESITRNIAQITELTSYDREIFAQTLKNLGKSDVDSQISMIRNGITVIETQIQEANEIKNKNAKLYRTIGAISGLMIVIVFI